MSSRKCQAPNADPVGDWLQKPLSGGTQVPVTGGRPGALEFLAPHIHRHMQNQLPHPALADLSMQAGVQQVSSNRQHGDVEPCQ